MTAHNYAVLDARLDAQREVLRWILAGTVVTPVQFANLIDSLDKPMILQDHQEDPGAVPTEAFGSISAYTTEMRAILDPVKRQHDGHKG